MGSEDQVDDGADIGVAAVPDPGGSQAIAQRDGKDPGIAKIERFQFGEEDVKVAKLDPAKNLVGVGLCPCQHTLTVGVTTP